jgi:hypothetical protein
VTSIEKNRNKNLNKISRTMESQLSEKMKKINYSINNIRKEDIKKVNKLEVKKLNQYTSQHFLLIDYKEKINIQKQKEKEKYDSVKENYTILNKSLNEKFKEDRMKLNEKFQRISENNKNKFISLNEFIHKRKILSDKLYGNNLKNRMNFTRVGDSILSFQHLQNKKSIERNKSLYDYKEFMR